MNLLKEFNRSEILKIFFLLLLKGESRIFFIKELGHHLIQNLKIRCNNCKAFICHAYVSDHWVHQWTEISQEIDVQVESDDSIGLDPELHVSVLGEPPSKSDDQVWRFLVGYLVFQKQIQYLMEVVVVLKSRYFAI